MPSNITATTGAIAEVANQNAGLTWSGVQYAARLRWGDFDPQLRAAFKTACEKLERLLYAIYGSRVASYSPFKQWYHRTNPRCLWPEQFVQYPPDVGPCWAWRAGHHETAATGFSGSPGMFPSVPIRSVSPDWRLQAYVEGVHDRTVFPVGSVERFDGNQAGYSGEPVFDPLGTGDFGGDPNMIGSDGPYHVDGEPVPVWYTPPASLADSITSVTLHYQSSAVAMTRIGAYWTASIPAHPHNTLVRWHLEVQYDTGSGAQVRYDPGGALPPEDGQRYSYTAFTHWNPYPHGLPEFWSLCKKGTDEYRFDETETVQPELLNLMRWTLEYLGEHFYHSPHAHPGTCCWPIHIKWRWLGAAPWPYARGTAKDAEWPLHNLDRTPAPASAERRTWRGAGRLFPSNPYYGQGASWQAHPTQIISESGFGRCDNTYEGRTAGLQHGDVIRAEHIQQIIDAVDYIVANGIWTQVPVRLSQKTPNIAWEVLPGYTLGCGDSIYYAKEGSSDPYINPTYARKRGPNSMPDFVWCCASVTYDDQAGEWVCTPYDPPSSWQDCWANANGPCRTYRTHGCNTDCWGGWYDPPSYPPHFRSSTCYWGVTCGWFAAHVDCYRWGLLQVDTRISCRDSLGAEMYQHWEGEEEPLPEEYPGPCSTLAHVRHSSAGKEWANQGCAYSAYLCGPQICPNGTDAVHGNGVTKLRYVGEPGNYAPDPQLPSAGNCFAEFRFCAGGRLKTIAGEGVTDVDAHSLQESWIGHRCGYTLHSCDYEPVALRDIPDDTGMQHYDPQTGAFNCETIDRHVEGDVYFRPEYWWFECLWSKSHSVHCNEEDHHICDSGLSGWAWAAIDLNLDGNGMPTLRDYQTTHSADYTDEECTTCPTGTEPM